MLRLLSIITIVLAIILFPPATLAVISNNAVPGDTTYPIKRALEDGIFAIASLTPFTKAWFAAARSDRRFKEVTVLIDQGKPINETLNELVDQTNSASDQIDRVKSNTEKEKLLGNLSKNIEKYDKGLKEASEKKIAPQSTPNPQSQTTVKPQASLVPTQANSPSQNVTITHIVEYRGPSAQEIGEARKRLEEIRQRLEEERRRLEEERLKELQQTPMPTPSQTPRPTPEPTATLKPTPLPTLSPTLTPHPTSTPAPSPSGNKKFKLFQEGNTEVIGVPSPSPADN